MANDYHEKHEHSVVWMVQRIVYGLLPVLALPEDQLHHAQRLFNPEASRPYNTSELLTGLDRLPKPP